MADTPTPKSPKNLDFLHKPAGPLPVGGWIIVVGAGLAFQWWRKRQTPTVTNTADTQLQPGFTDQTVGNVFSLMALLNKGETGQSTQTIQDNTSWFAQAERLLIGRGNNPTLVDNALRKYMQGMTLTREEEAVKELALQLVGPIPTPPPPPQTTPGPTDPHSPSRISSLRDWVPVDFGSIGGQLSHLSNNDLISGANLTYNDVVGIDNTGWGQVAGMQYGTDQPLPFLNEIARRYQAGTLTDAELNTGPTGSWTNGQPAWRMNQADIVNRINYLTSQGVTSGS